MIEQILNILVFAVLGWAVATIVVIMVYGCYRYIPYINSRRKKKMKPIYQKWDCNKEGRHRWVRWGSDDDYETVCQECGKPLISPIVIAHYYCGAKGKNDER